MAHSLSQFLPDEFNPTDGICLIAGKELYPELIADRMRQQEVRSRLIAWEYETRDSLYDAFPDGHRVRLKVGKLSRMLKSLKNYEVKWAMMAGHARPWRETLAQECGKKRDDNSFSFFPKGFPP